MSTNQNKVLPLTIKTFRTEYVTLLTHPDAKSLDLKHQTCPNYGTKKHRVVYHTVLPELNKADADGGQ